MANRTVSVALRAEVAGFVSGLRTAKQATSDFRSELNQAAKKGSLDGVATAATGVGLALAGMAAYAVHAGMQFDKQMSSVKAATHASASEMESLRQAALDAGAATVFSATDAAKAQTELAKAGLSTAQILGGGLKGALDLAAAGQLGVGEAAEAAATAMTQFKLSGKDIPHVADLLAAGAGKAQGEVSDMAAALKQSGLVANQFGVSIEETTGTLAAFASAGLIGSDAGTSFKSMLLMLANPSKESASLMRELGIRAYDATGKFVGIRDLAGQLQTKMAGLTQAQRDQALAQIFGSDAIRSANVLYQQGATGIQDWTEKVDATGFALDTAREKTDNLAGDVERLKGSLETMAISSGSGVAGGLRTLTQMADSAVGAFAALPVPVQSAATVIAGLGGAALLGVAGMVKVKGVVNDALTGLREMGPTGEKAAGGLGKVASGLGKVAVGAAAAEAGILLVGAAWRAFNDNHPALTIEQLAKALERVGEGENLNALGKSVKEFDLDLQTLSNNTMDNVSHRVSALVEGMANIGDLDGTFTKARADIAKIDEALAAMVNSHNADEAAAAFARITEQAEKQGISVNELKAGFPQYAAALDGARTAADLHGQAEKVAAEKVETMASSLQEAVEKAGSLKDAFDTLNGATLGWAETEINAEAAVDKLSESMAKNGTTMKVNTAEGRANKEALLGGIKAARDAAQAKLDESHSLEQANATYELYKQKLIDTIATQGGTQRATDQTREAARKLVEQFGQMPSLVQTQVTAPGLPPTRAELAEYSRGLDRIDGRVVNTYANHYVNTYVRYYDDGRSNRGNSRYGPNDYAKGGIRRAQLGMIIPPSDPGTILTAEPETGGEALIPLRGISRGRAAMLGKTALGGYGLDVVPRDQRWHGGQAMTPAMLAALAGSGKGPGGGLNVEHLEVRAYSDRFSLAQVQGELYMHGAH